MLKLALVLLLAIQGVYMTPDPEKCKEIMETYTKLMNDLGKNQVVKGINSCEHVPLGGVYTIEANISGGGHLMTCNLEIYTLEFVRTTYKCKPALLNAP